MAVVAHNNSSTESAKSHQQYEVSIRIADTTYTVLYTPPPGVNSVEYYAGLQLLVAVEKDKLVFNSRLSGPTEVPILRRETAPSQSRFDWSKGPSQYYSMKLQQLSEALNLNGEQQRQVKPILEQEAGELNYLWGNPAVSSKEKLESWQRTVQGSDRKMKPFLSHDQWNQLQQMRQQEKEDLKQHFEQNQSGRQK